MNDHSEPDGTRKRLLAIQKARLSRKRGGDLLGRSIRFKLHVHYLTEPKRRVWAVEFKARHPEKGMIIRYLISKKVFVRVNLETVFRGPKAAQPKAYLSGRGRITETRDMILIEP